jgi:hypothetical protein
VSVPSLFWRPGGKVQAALAGVGSEALCILIQGFETMGLRHWTDADNCGTKWGTQPVPPLFHSRRGRIFRSSRPLWRFRLKLTNRKKCVRPRCVLSGIPALGEPSLAGLEVFDPEGPSASPAKEHDVEGFVHDDVGVPALGEFPVEAGSDRGCRRRRRFLRTEPRPRSSFRLMITALMRSSLRSPGVRAGGGLEGRRGREVLV